MLHILIHRLIDAFRMSEVLLTSLSPGHWRQIDSWPFEAVPTAVKLHSLVSSSLKITQSEREERREQKGQGRERDTLYLSLHPPSVSSREEPSLLHC